jgi:hypothetical protein
MLNLWEPWPTRFRVVVCTGTGSDKITLMNIASALAGAGAILRVRQVR